MSETLEQTAWQLFAESFNDYADECIPLKCVAGSRIVRNGIMTPKGIDLYTSVPLAYIKSGSVSIIQNGTAVKYYSAGECFGLFEVACFLEKGVKDRIGRWDVEAVTDVELLVSTRRFLNQTPKSTKDALIIAAKENPVAKPLSKLPLLDWFAATFGIEPQDNLAIAYHSHIMPSSVELIKHFAYLAGPDNTFVLEKPYSTMPSAFHSVAAGGVHTCQLTVDPFASYEYSIKRGVDFFWREIKEHLSNKHIDKLIVVSDGADVLLSPLIQDLEIPIIGVEQTERGLKRLASANLAFPVISIAATRAKKVDEAIFIAEACLNKIASRSLISLKLTYGILGLGALGSQIAKGLRQRGITPLIYDPTTLNTKRYTAHSMEELVQESDIIIGTTGTDCLRGMYLERLTGNKTFISTSSSNIEFAYLFDLAKTYSTSFEDIVLSISKDLTITVLNGGYPINFDRTQEWELQSDIQLTRCLLYGAVFEALSVSPKTHPKNLESGLEHQILAEWKRQQRTTHSNRLQR